MKRKPPSAIGLYSFVAPITMPSAQTSNGRRTLPANSSLDFGALLLVFFLVIAHVGA
jgi:hypothetical protein